MDLFWPRKKSLIFIMLLEMVHFVTAEIGADSRGSLAEMVQFVAGQEVHPIGPNNDYDEQSQLA